MMWRGSPWSGSSRAWRRGQRLRKDGGVRAGGCHESQKMGSRDRARKWGVGTEHLQPRACPGGRDSWQDQQGRVLTGAGARTGRSQVLHVSTAADCSSCRPTRSGARLLPDSDSVKRGPAPSQPRVVISPATSILRLAVISGKRSTLNNPRVLVGAQENVLMG